MAATKREQLEKLVHDMQALADNCDAKGEFDAADQERMVKMATDAKALKEQITAEAEATGTLNDTKDFLKSLGAKPGDVEPVDELKAQADHTGIAKPDGNKTLGQLFAESQAYDEFRKRYVKADGTISNATRVSMQPYELPGFNKRASFSLDDQKALVTGTSSTSGGAFVMTDRYPVVTDLIGQRELTIRDLCTQTSTSSDTVDYVRVTGKTNNASIVTEASVTTASALGGHGIKPESALALEVVSTTVETIAHWIPITKRAAADANQVRTLVDTFLLYGLREIEEDEILNGSGVSPHLTGINNASPLTVGSAGTDIDAIVDAIRTIRVTGRRNPNALVIHPNDWFSTSFLLAKDTNTGQYLIGDPRASVDQLNSLWGLRVVTTPAQAENTALVGEFRFCVIWDREGASIQVSDSPADFFLRNMFAILAEERLAVGILDDDAFCQVTSV